MSELSFIFTYGHAELVDLIISIHFKNITNSLAINAGFFFKSRDNIKHPKA
jgi:hypothetical protein